jgi:hypothetical protein
VCVCARVSVCMREREGTESQRDRHPCLPLPQAGSLELVKLHATLSKTQSIEDVRVRLRTRPGLSSN